MGTADRDNRFSGWDLATLTSLAGLGQASYDYGNHCWYVSSPMTHRAGMPSHVPDVDWREPEPGQPAPLLDREAVPGVRVCLTEDLSTVLEIPGGAARLSVDDTCALTDAIAEVRQLRAIVEADRCCLADGPDVEAGE